MLLGRRLSNFIFLKVSTCADKEDNLTGGEVRSQSPLLLWLGNGNRNYGQTIVANGATWTLAIQSYSKLSAQNIFPMVTRAQNAHGNRHVKVQIHMQNVTPSPSPSFKLSLLSPSKGVELQIDFLWPHEAAAHSVVVPHEVIDIIAQGFIVMNE